MVRSTRRVSKSRRNNNARKNNTRNNRVNNLRGGSGIFQTVVAPVTGTLSLAGNVAGRGLNLVVNIPTDAIKGTKNVLSKSVRNLVSGVGRLGNNTASGLNRTVRRTFGKNN
jgi:hypothetical protein